VGYLLARKGEPMLLSTLATKEAMIEEFRDLLPDVTRDQWRRIRGEQEIVARYEPEQAIATLPALLADPRDRERLMTLMSRLLSDERIRRANPTAEQKAMLATLGRTLGMSRPSGATRRLPGKATAKRPRARGAAAGARH
jgi:hypothetical protein